jgi:hypothetical protein
MANMCYHFVTCTGSAANIKKFNKVIQDGIEHMRTFHEATSLGVDIQEGYFFDVEIQEQEQPIHLVFRYETKWAPNLKDLAVLAKRHKLDMECEYNECGIGLYGKATIDKHGFVNDDEVSGEFMDLIEYNEETGLYEYDGIEYETEGDIIDEHYENWKFLNPQNS